jgi:hypothetical protein
VGLKQPPAIDRTDGTDVARGLGAGSVRKDDTVLSFSMVSAVLIQVRRVSKLTKKDKAF